jgi:hypothetical protein
MNELIQAELMLADLDRIIKASLINDYAVVVATNKRIVIRFTKEHHANITVHNLKREHRMNGNYHPLNFQIEKGLRSTYYYLQVQV